MIIWEALSQGLGTVALRRLQVAWSASALGSWIFFVALAVYAYDAGGTTAVGAAALVRMVPAGLAAPLVGVVVDRRSRRDVLVATLLLRAGLLAAIAAAVAAKAPIGAVLALAALFTIAAAAHKPAQAALLPALAQTPRHVRGALDWFARADARGAGPAPAARPSPRRAALGDDGWLVSPVFAPGELARLPLFASLTARERARVAAWAREARVATGEAVTRRWEAARDFYVVVEGRAAAERDGRAVAEFRPGDFFGELAALDWGAGYGYGRQATVTAVEPLRLLVLAPAHLARLMAAAPSVDAAVRRAAQERLDRVAADT